MPARGDPDAKAPRTFPQWAQRVGQYGQRRRFPEMILLGAEHILARIYHEHHTTRLYTPVTLGEILAARAFSAGGLNPLVIDRRTAATGTQALQSITGDQTGDDESK